MASLQPLKTLLTIGVYSVPGVSHESIKSRIDSDNAVLAGIGIAASVHYIDLQDHSPKDPALTELFPKMISDTKQKLNSQQWDCVNIGYGVRGLIELTPLFEGLINAVLELTPVPKMVFAVKPDGASEAVKRLYGLEG